MAQDREKIFRLVETADDIVEDAAPGKDARVERGQESASKRGGWPT